MQQISKEIWGEPSIQKLLSCFQEIGTQIPFWTQGQGSNLSVKCQDYLFIKPSGYRLVDVISTENLAGLSLSLLRNFLKPSEGKHARNQNQNQNQNQDQGQTQTQAMSETSYASLLGQAENSKGKICRASMETGFHALLPGKYVFHFHSLAAIMMAEKYYSGDIQFKSWLEKIAKNYSRHCDEVTFLPFVIPGLRLSFELSNLNKGKASGIILMRNHGVVLHFDDFALFQFWKQLETDFYKEFLNQDFAKIKQMCCVEVINKFNCTMPLKIFFPDMAVFKDQVQKLLSIPEGSTGQMRPLADSMLIEHRDFAELWLATMILYRLYPEMSEIDQNQGLEISQLPTEQFRKGKS